MIIGSLENCQIWLQGSFEDLSKAASQFGFASFEVRRMQTRVRHNLRGSVPIGYRAFGIPENILLLLETQQLNVKSTQISWPSNIFTRGFVLILSSNTKYLKTKLQDSVNMLNIKENEK